MEKLVECDGITDKCWFLARVGREESDWREREDCTESKTERGGGERTTHTRGITGSVNRETRTFFYVRSSWQDVGVTKCWSVDQSVPAIPRWWWWGSLTRGAWYDLYFVITDWTEMIADSQTARSCLSLLLSSSLGKNKLLIIDFSPVGKFGGEEKIS